MTAGTKTHNRNNLAREGWKKFDDFIFGVTTIPSTHRMIHDGFSFHSVARAAGLIDTGTAEFLIAVGEGYPHVNSMLFSLSNSPCDIDAYEGTTVSSLGTPIAAFNRNRNSTRTPAIQNYGGPTITDDGVLLHSVFVPDAGGQGSHDVGVLSPGIGEEWILKPNTNYLVRLTNRSGGAIEFTGEMLWYEPQYSDKRTSYVDN